MGRLWGVVGDIGGGCGGVIPTMGGRGDFFKKRGAQLLVIIFPGKIDFFSDPPLKSHRYYFSKKFFPLPVTLSP